MLTTLGILAGGLKGSWEALWQNLFRDHGHAGLIWNERTRSELLEALHVRNLCVSERHLEACLYVSLLCWRRETLLAGFAEHHRIQFRQISKA